MTLEELKRLVADGEGERLEKKTGRQLQGVAGLRPLRDRRRF